MSGEGDYGAFGAYEEGSALRVGADGVELDAGFFLRANAGGFFGWAEVVDELGVDNEEAIRVLAIVGYCGVIGLRENPGEGPGFAAIVGEG